MTTPKFDSVLPHTIRILEARFRDSQPETILVRDALGKVSVTLPDTAISNTDEWNSLADALHQELGKYSPGSKRILLRYSDLIIPEDILESPDRVLIPDTYGIWLVDRLQTNQDWLRKPLVEKPPLPTAVAFSIKGGVGRTTAFVVWAWHLARLGKNIVLVDLDLEAPGIAGTLLDEDHLPDYGLVDWLVEALVGRPDESLLRECLAECTLSSDEPGRIRVLPAFGKKTSEYVNKLGRIYMPTFTTETGKFSGLAERLLMLLEQLESLSGRPDAVLLDARAGLHDIGSAAVTQLGAEVFLFARDDYQSWQAYRQLFRHLSKSRSISISMPDDDLRWRLKMVGAQLDPTEVAPRRFEDSSYTLWSDELYDEGVTLEEEETLRESGELIPQVFDREDAAPHSPLTIRFSSEFKSFNLIDPQMYPDWLLIETAFGDFFLGATARLFPNDAALEEF